MPISQNDCAIAQAEYNDCVGTGQNPGFCVDFVEDAYPGFQNCGGNGGGSNGSPLTEYWNNPSNWIDFTGGLAGIVGGIVGMANGQPIYTTTTPPNQQQQADNTVWWIVGAVAILLVILLLVVIFKK